MIEAWYIEIENSLGMCQTIPFASEEDAIKALPIIKESFSGDEYTIDLFNSKFQMPMTFEEFMSKS